MVGDSPDSHTIVDDPVYRVGYRFWRSTGSDGEPIQHVEMWVRPGGGVPAHVHPVMEERFTVLEGPLELLSGRRWRAVPTGRENVVPPGSRHAFRNRGDETAHVRVEARPPSSLQGFLEDVAGLSRAGKLTRAGLPKPGAFLHAAVLAHRYRDMVVLGFPSPPRPVQRLLFPPLARLAERRGIRAGEMAKMA